MKWLGFLIILALLTCSGKAYGGTLQSANFPSLISSVNGVDGVSFCDEKVPIEIQEVRERLEKEWNHAKKDLAKKGVIESEDSSLGEVVKEMVKKAGQELGGGFEGQNLVEKVKSVMETEANNHTENAKYESEVAKKSPKKKLRKTSSKKTQKTKKKKEMKFKGV